MGHWGFSYVGLIYLLLLAIPNLLWARHQPRGYQPADEQPLLLLLERVGQVAVAITALFFSDFNLRPWTPWSIWLIASFLLMVLYELWRVRYFRSQQSLADFYSSMLGIPVAGATLPVLAFLLLGVYGRVLWMIVAVVILGIGHIGIHLQHARQLARQQ